MALTLDENVTAFLSRKIESGQAMLFTGAGFSMDCKDIAGERLPSGDKLAREIWALLYDNADYDKEATLPDVYALAISQKRPALEKLLKKRLTVAPPSIPALYKTILSAPWKRIYTVNVDNLCQAAARQFDLPFDFFASSGTRYQTPPSLTRNATKPRIEIIHLNGTIDDIPDFTTFSREQYSDRLGSQQPAYHQLVADLASHSFIFVGTKLDEPILWQHIVLRGQKGGRHYKELRPRSFLVTPSLPQFKRTLLEEYNCQWVEGYTEHLAETLATEPFLGSCAKGRSRLGRTASARAASDVNVAHLLSSAPKREPSAFLSGFEPVWADLRLGHAIERECDKELRATADKCVGQNPTQVLIVTGTAASGKTVSAMRLAAALSANQQSCYWIGAVDEISIPELRRLGSDLPNGSIIFIDDADRFGAEATNIARDFQVDGSLALIVLVMRSQKVDRAVDDTRLMQKHLEYAVPNLADSDIDGLIEQLDRTNMLGKLKGKTDKQRRDEFRDRAGRQLLVAMLEATSDRKFEERLIDEWESLGSEAERNIYALLAIAHSMRVALTRDEVLFAAGESASAGESNQVLNALQRLSARQVVAFNDADLTYRTRHRHLADILVSELAVRRLVLPLVADLAYVFATKVSAQTHRNDRASRLLRHLINHEYLFRNGTLEQARAVFQRTEGLLSWSHHHYLQRGSLEVEHGDLRAAENYLSSARSLDATDPYVATAYAYMRFKRACEEPAAANAAAFADEAMTILREQIRSRGAIEAHSYHVMGSQGLKWSRRASLSAREREVLVRELESVLKEGTAAHPRNTNLRTLYSDLQSERIKLSGTP